MIYGGNIEIPVKNNRRYLLANVARYLNTSIRDNSCKNI